MKLFWSVVSSFALLLVLSSTVQAQSSDFRTELSSIYQVGVTGTTQVSKQFSIINLTPTKAITEYVLTLPYTDLRNVAVLDQQGMSIPHTLVSTDLQTNIGITFAEPATGLGKAQTFTITFTSQQLALVGGQVLEVSIAGHQQSNVAHQVELQTPLSYGEANLIYPEVNATQTQTESSISTFFPEVGEESIVARFGQSQSYQLELEYQLFNQQTSSSLFQIALPPDTSWQRVVYQQLDPAPLNIKTDPDGNWLATYRLQGEETLQVSAKLELQVQLEPNTQVTVPVPDQRWTNQFQPYWQSEILELAGASSGQPIQELYDLTVTRLSYNQAKIESGNPRLGAIEAWRDPQNAVCTEFVDVFVALGRASGTPTRRIVGYAVSQQPRQRPLSLAENTLHAWAEYWDPSRNLWIPVDPTWENTTGGIDYFSTFDLNHLTFAINGLSAEFPLPAGTYQTQPAQDTIQVGYATEFQLPEPSWQAEASLGGIARLPLTGWYQFSITNTTGAAWYQVPVTLSTNRASSSLNQSSITVLPWQTVTITGQLQNQDLLRPLPTTAILAVGDQQFQFQLTSGSQLSSFVGSRLGVGLSLAVIAIGTGSVLVFRRR